MIAFKKICEPEMDASAVNLTLAALEGASYGRIIGPAELIPKAMSLELGVYLGEWELADSAVRTATKIAESNGCQVAVIDPEDLWNHSWGKLT